MSLIQPFQGFVNFCCPDLNVSFSLQVLVRFLQAFLDLLAIEIGVPFEKFHNLLIFLVTDQHLTLDTLAVVDYFDIGIVQQRECTVLSFPAGSEPSVTLYCHCCRGKSSPLLFAGRKGLAATTLQPRLRQVTRMPPCTPEPIRAIHAPVTGSYS